MSAPMSVFQKLWKGQMFCDALLNVAGTQFLAHKLVLCGCSTYFRSLFTNWSDPDDREFTLAVDVSADIMKIILDYAYTRVVHITQENLIELFEAADFFDISEITQACYQAMTERLSSTTCIATWELTQKYYNPHLKNQVFFYILKHFEEVMDKSNVFLCLSLENLCSIIVEDQLNVKDESIVFEAVLKWIGHAPQERNKYLANLLSKIRLALIHPEYYTQHIRSNILIQNNPACQAMMMQLDALTRGSNVLYLARPRMPQEVLLAIGGMTNNNSSTNIIESYDKSAKCWVDVANFDRTLTPRHYHGTVFLHGSVYLIGGSEGVHQLCTSHKYDLANHTWQEIAPMHTLRSLLSVALVDGFIYAMGGFNGQHALSTAEKYFPDTNQWTLIAPMNEMRSNSSSTTYNRKIYICGGFNEMCLSTAEYYNPLTNQWTIISGMSSTRRGAGVISYFNEIYVLGGFDGEDYLSTVEAYNPNTDTWRPLPSMLCRRHNFGIGVVKDKLYAVGGFNGLTTLNCVESFDGETEVWSLEFNMNISRSGLSCTMAYDLPNMADYSAAHSSPPEEVPEV